MRVTCPVCWHSVVTIVVCKTCQAVQCLEYEGPVCLACGGHCRFEIAENEQLVETSASNSE